MELPLFGQLQNSRRSRQISCFFKVLTLGAAWILAIRPAAADEPEQSAPFRAVAFSADGKLLAAGLGEREGAGGLIVWNVADQRVIRQLKAELGISTVAFSPDGRLLAFTKYDRPPSVLDVALGEMIWELAEPCRGGVAFSPDGKLLACSGSDNGVHQFDVESRSEMTKIEGGNERASGRISFSCDGKFLVTPSGSAGASLWDLATGKALQRFKHGQHYVRSAEFSPDGEWIITGGYDGTVRIWNSKTGNLRARLSGMGGVYGLAISPDGKLLVVAAGKHLLLFDIWLSPPRVEDILLVQNRLIALESDSYATRQSASEGLVALGFRAESILQQAAENSPEAEIRIRARLARQRILSEPSGMLRGHTSEVNGICISPDGQKVASASDDGTVRLWDANSAKEIALLRATPFQSAPK